MEPHSQNPNKQFGILAYTTVVYSLILNRQNGIGAFRTSGKDAASIIDHHYQMGFSPLTAVMALKPKGITR